MTDASTTPAPEAGNATVRESGPLSLNEGATRLAGLMGDEPEREDSPSEAAPASEAQPKPEEGEKVPEPDPDDWDAPDQTGEEGASEEQAEAGEAEGQPSEQGRFVGDDAKVRLADGRTVTVGELRSGSMMQADYTRKTQELAEQRRSVEARQAEFEQHAQAIHAQRELAMLVLQQNVPPAPDPALLREDPVGFMEAKTAREAWEQQMSGLLQAHQAEQQRISQQSVEQTRARIAEEAEKLFSVIPELRDEGKRNRWSADLRDTARHYGFTDDDLASVMDHRVLRLATDAMRYRRIEANRAKSAEKAQGKPPAQPIGTGPRQSPQANAARAKDELRREVRRTGRLDDGAKAISNLL
jgi:hypothetical protein